MKIGLDARMINNSGIGVSIRGLLDHWTPVQRGAVTLFSPPEFENPYGIRAVPSPESVYGLSQHWTHARRVEAEKLDLFHMPHFDIPYFYRGLLVATVHDLIHVLYPEHSTKPFSRAYAKFQIGQVVKRAARIICVSENTKNDLEKYFPGAARKATVLYPAAGPHFRPQTNEEMAPVLARHGLTPGYLLYVGNLRGNKNTPRLLAAFAQARLKTKDLPPLVLVGHNTYRQYDAGWPHGVRYVGTVPVGDLPALYSGASMFVFPSIYEGFGIPPLEAMACGTPVISSNAASLPEVCGAAAVYIDPLSERSLADAISDLWASPSRRAGLRERGLERAQRFNWETFAQGTWKVYEEALGGRP